jgi:hypothetical protein
MRTYLLAEFDNPEKLLHATTKTRELGFADVDTYSPYPLHHGSEALGLTFSWVPTIAACGALTGLISGYGLQWWASTIAYPINVGNRLLHSAPAFIPITFELGILFTALSIFFGLLALSRLPQPYHPVFELEAFRSASTHGYWLSVVTEETERRDNLSQQLREWGATTVEAVQEPTT